GSAMGRFARRARIRCGVFEQDRVDRGDLRRPSAGRTVPGRLACERARAGTSARRTSKLGVRLPELARSPRGVGIGVVSALCLGLGFLPLFAGPGYEQTIACGLFLPTVTALVTAWEAFVDRHAPARDPLGIVRRGVENGVLFSGVAIAIAFLHGLRVGLCDP